MSDPLQRRGLIAKALDSDPMLPPDQLDVLVRYAQLFRISQQCDPMLRILGELPEVREKAGSLDVNTGFDEWTDMRTRERACLSAESATIFKNARVSSIVSRLNNSALK